MTHLKFLTISDWVAAFIRDCKSRDLSPNTIIFYRAQLKTFLQFCTLRDVIEVEAITPDLIRSYLLDLESTGHNAGGRHGKFRALRAFLFWWEKETEPDAWKNPIHKVKPPKLNQPVIEGVSLEHVVKILSSCLSNFVGVRDRAILLCLLDSGARVTEFLNLNLEDVDLIRGDVIIRKGKNRKPRVVFIGKKSRRALRAYLTLRTDDNAALWVTRAGDRFTVRGMQSMLKNRAKLVNIPVPSPHDFRRAMALNMLRTGVDIFSLQLLMGHSGLSVLRRYLAQNADDLRTQFERNSPADRL